MHEDHPFTLTHNVAYHGPWTLSESRVGGGGPLHEAVCARSPGKAWIQRQREASVIKIKTLLRPRARRGRSTPPLNVVFNP